MISTSDSVMCARWRGGAAPLARARTCVHAFCIRVQVVTDNEAGLLFKNKRDR